MENIESYVVFHIFKKSELKSIMLLTANKKFPPLFNIYKFNVVLFVNEIVIKIAL